MDQARIGKASRQGFWLIRLLLFPHRHQPFSLLLPPTPPLPTSPVRATGLPPGAWRHSRVVYSPTGGPADPARDIQRRAAGFR